MDLEYFVILNNSKGMPVPLMMDDSMGFFLTEEEAIDAANSSFFGREYGYELFMRGEGILSN